MNSRLGLWKEKDAYWRNSRSGFWREKKMGDWWIVDLGFENITKMPVGQIIDEAVKRIRWGLDV